MSRPVVLIALAVILVGASLPALAGTLAEEVAAAREQIKAEKLTEAEARLMTGAAATVADGLDKLAAPELLALADAYRLLMALSYDRAIKAGTLDGEALKTAKAERRKVLGIKNMKVVGNGAEVDLAAEIAPGKTNIVDFYSIYCGPCMQLAPYLEALADTRDDIFLVKVNVDRPGSQGIDWQSPTAKQFKLKSIPHLKVFGPDGKLQREGDPAYQSVIKMLQDAGCE